MIHPTLGSGRQLLGMIHPTLGADRQSLGAICSTLGSGRPSSKLTVRHFVRRLVNHTITLRLWAKAAGASRLGASGGLFETV